MKYMFTVREEIEDMENEIKTNQFCGFDLYAWKEWDIMDTDNFYYYDVEFLVPSMQKYNGMDVGQWFDGKMEIYGGNNGEEVVWSGHVTDIDEVMLFLKNKSVGTNEDKVHSLTSKELASLSVTSVVLGGGANIWTMFRGAFTGIDYDSREEAERGELEWLKRPVEEESV